MKKSKEELKNRKKKFFANSWNNIETVLLKIILEHATILQNSYTKGKKIILKYWYKIKKVLLKSCSKIDKLSLKESYETK